MVNFIWKQIMRTDELDLASQDSLASNTDLHAMSPAQLREEILRLREENNALEIRFCQQEQIITDAALNLADAETVIGALQQQLNAHN